MKNKKIAAFLSFLFPGFGHLYIGKYADAVVLIAVTAFLYYAVFVKSYLLLTFQSLPKAILVFSAIIFIYLYAIIDAWKKTK